MPNAFNELQTRQNALEAELMLLKRFIQAQSVDEGSLSNAYFEQMEERKQAITQMQGEMIHLKHAKIGSARIEEGAITHAHIGKGEIENAHLQNASIDESKIKHASIDSLHLKDGIINNAKLANLAVNTANIMHGAITQALIARSAVGQAQIANASITDAKIVSLTASKITAGVLEVARLIVTGENSIVEAINKQTHSPHQSTHSIDGHAITNHTLTAEKLVAGSITAKELASRSITANHLTTQSVGAEHIQSNAIDATHIRAGTIEASHLASGVGESLNLSSNQSIKTKVERTELLNLATKSDIQSTVFSTLEQNEQGFALQVQALKNGLNDLEQRLETFKNLTQTWLKFNDQGLSLGQTGSPFEAKLSHKALEFLAQGLTLARFEGEKLLVQGAKVNHTLALGEHFELKAELGHITLRAKSV